jgi:hypothetical protein
VGPSSHRAHRKKLVPSYSRETPPNAGADFATAFLNAVGKQLPSSLEKQGDDQLNQARDLVTNEVRSMVEEDDLRDIEEKIN